MPDAPAFVPPVDALNQGHASLWGNLGDWSEASGYVEAAEALARRLGRAAGLGPGQRVLDLGVGAGDQLRLWTEVFGVEGVTAVERDSSLAATARARVAAWGLEGRVRVVAESASTRRASTADRADGPVDAVLALDSAYFFESRTRFLEGCRWALRPGGVLALTDLLLGDGPAARLALGMAPLFGVPRGSLLSEDRYRAGLSGAGFDRISIQDLTTEVLVGFARWARSGEGGPGTLRPWAFRMGISVTGRAAGFFARSNGLRYVLVTARRRDP